MPSVPGDDPVAATVPRLRSVTPAGGGALGDGRVLAAASALGALGSLAGWLLAARTVAPDRLGAAVAVVAVVAVAACAARPDRGAALVPRLPAAGRQAGRVVVRSLAAAVALGAGAGAVLAVLVPGPAATLSGLLPGPPLAALARACCSSLPRRPRGRRARSSTEWWSPWTGPGGRPRTWRCWSPGASP